MIFTYLIVFQAYCLYIVYINQSSRPRLNVLSFYILSWVFSFRYLQNWRCRWENLQYFYVVCVVRLLLRRLLPGDQSTTELTVLTLYSWSLWLGAARARCKRGGGEVERRTSSQTGWRCRCVRLAVSSRHVGLYTLMMLPLVSCLSSWPFVWIRSVHAHNQRSAG